MATLASGLARAPTIEMADTPVPYAQAVARMETRVAAIAAGDASECLWFLEHPPVITAGTSAAATELLAPDRYPVVPTGRGGRHTFHGPGQRIVYAMLDLARRGRDVRALVCGLEAWIIAALAELGVAGLRHPLGPGVWVETGEGPAKVAALGIRVRRWVSFHGIAINVAPDLDGFAAVVPCGIEGAHVARLADLDPAIDLAALDRALLLTRGVLFSALPETDRA
jgi:lipoyl(octanoyl) transferase